jgi:hypothetical protein
MRIFSSEQVLEQGFRVFDGTRSDERNDAVPFYRDCH